jgi:hypothetical protein
VRASDNPCPAGRSPSGGRAAPLAGQAQTPAQARRSGPPGVGDGPPEATAAEELEGDHFPFGPRGSTVSGRHVYGCAAGAGNLRFDAATMASFRIRCASSHSRLLSNAVRLARLHRLDPTGSSTHSTHAHSAAEGEGEEPQRGEGDTGPAGDHQTTRLTNAPSHV